MVNTRRQSCATGTILRQLLLSVWRLHRGIKPGRLIKMAARGIRAEEGYYRNAGTLGGFDQFTAILGGFWDSMLGEGRRWWVTANSDSHVHYV